MPERELTPRAVAKILGRDWRTVIKMYDRGELKGRETHGPRGQRRIYIPVSELDRYTETERAQFLGER